jgi:hypothetical protein
MKNFTPLAILLAATLMGKTSLSQESASEGKIEYSKGDKIAAVIEMPYSADVVEDAIKDYMDKQGLKADHSKGFNVFHNAKPKIGDPEISDLHFKIEKKSHKEKDVAVVYLLIGRPGENMAMRTGDDKYKIDEAKEYLNRMAPSIEAYNLEIEIKTQEEVVKKAEKKKSDLEDDQKDLEKKIKNLQAKLDENKGDQKSQGDEVLKVKTVLEMLKGKRRG